MDPQESLYSLLDAINDRDEYMTTLFCQSLSIWIDKGGHFPKVIKEEDGSITVNRKGGN